MRLLDCWQTVLLLVKPLFLIGNQRERLHWAQNEMWGLLSERSPGDWPSFLKECSGDNGPVIKVLCQRSRMSHCKFVLWGLVGFWGAGSFSTFCAEAFALNRLDGSEIRNDWTPWRCQCSKYAVTYCPTLRRGRPCSGCMCTLLRNGKAHGSAPCMQKMPEKGCWRGWLAMRSTWHIRLSLRSVKGTLFSKGSLCQLKWMCRAPILLVRYWWTAKKWIGQKKAPTLRPEIKNFTLVV